MAKINNSSKEIQLFNAPTLSTSTQPLGGGKVQDMTNLRALWKNLSVLDAFETVLETFQMSVTPSKLFIWKDTEKNSLLTDFTWVWISSLMERFASCFFFTAKSSTSGLMVIPLKEG